MLQGWGAGGEAPQPWGDSQDEGAGFLEPTEGLEKPTGVLTLPGQSFDGLDDLVMQIAEGRVGWGCSDREKTELEQQAHHLGVPSTVGAIPRPLEPKHAAGKSARHWLSPACTEKGVQPRVAGHPTEAPPCSGRAGLASGRMGFATGLLRSLKKASSRTAFWNLQ